MYVSSLPISPAAAANAARSSVMRRAHEMKFLDFNSPLTDTYRERLRYLLAYAWRERKERVAKAQPESAARLGVLRIDSYSDVIKIYELVQVAGEDAYDRVLHELPATNFMRT